ncbi:hypothetical protein [Loktanella sp. S4079]|uniref:hypothetical protein n=1 Tax=Loktanella sp. S4079 TaxID=579483 RepID=UPI0005FA8AAD|nr:hypothetical protein [Loktanella sp. S4079]KJZ18422.1 hypothetical protein TW80_13275 [Loktanella sp. S4079]
MIQQSSIGMVSPEYHKSHLQLDLIALTCGKKVMVGAIDVAANTIKTPKFVYVDKLCPFTNCGMAPHSRDVTRGKLGALRTRAEIVRKHLRYRRPV